MGLFCNDKSVTFLRGLGYNVLRHPRVSFRPLLLLGRQNGETLELGPLSHLITNAPGPLPPVTAGEVAADINGQSSSKLDIGIGANILGSVIGAMGGNLGINLGYTNAKKIEFVYDDVTLDSVVPLEVGNYLRSGEVDAGNLILQQYVLGNGELFLVTKVARSKKFSVKYERASGANATVDVPVLQQLAGANVKVGIAGGAASTVTFEGDVALAFGFQCFRVGVVDGVLELTAVKAGAVAAAAGDIAAEGAILNVEGLLDVR